MKANRDPRIDAYIAKSAGFAQPILRRLRKLVHQACPEAAETIKWGMPAYTCQGKILCGMAAFKAHATFGFWHQGMTAVLGGAGGKAEQAMGSMGRLTSLDDLPGDRELQGYIRQAAALIAVGGPTRPKSKPKKALSVPADLAAALKKSRGAGLAFEKFSPSQRRDYIEWIIEAKRDETRQKRLATTLEWVAEGKTRNWKYENC